MWPEESKAKAPEATFGPLLPVELWESHFTSRDPGFCRII